MHYSLELKEKKKKIYSLPLIKILPLSQLWSLIVNVAATETRRYRPTSRPKPWINLKPTLPIGVLAHGYWVPN